jgi:hypothetical protein
MLEGRRMSIQPMAERLGRPSIFLTQKQQFMTNSIRKVTL